MTVVTRLGWRSRISRRLIGPLMSAFAWAVERAVLRSARHG